MQSVDKRYVTYKISIQLLFFSYYADSKIYEIEKGKSTTVKGLKYSLLTLLFGFWGFSHLPWVWFKRNKTSLTALHINFNGAEDYTKKITELQYEEKVVWVYNNLKREIHNKTNIAEIDIVIEIQDEYKKDNEVLFGWENVNYIQT